MYNGVKVNKSTKQVLLLLQKMEFHMQLFNYFQLLSKPSTHNLPSAQPTSPQSLTNFNFTTAGKTSCQKGYSLEEKVQVLYVMPLSY